jgi:hypothetical protein
LSFSYGYVRLPTVTCVSGWKKERVRVRGRERERGRSETKRGIEREEKCGRNIELDREIVTES